MAKIEIVNERAAYATLAVSRPVQRPVILEVKLVVGEEVGPAVRQHLSVEEVGVHVGVERGRRGHPGDFIVLIARGQFQTTWRSLHRKLFRTGRTGARLHRVEDVRREATLVPPAASATATIVGGHFSPRQFALDLETRTRTLNKNHFGRTVYGLEC